MTRIAVTIPSLLISGIRSTGSMTMRVFRSSGIENATQVVQISPMVTLIATNASMHRK
jgi:hypothetical protein